MNGCFLLDDTTLLIFSARFGMPLDHVTGFHSGPVFTGKDFRDFSGKALVIARDDHDRIVFS
jgi:hypothetical protein